LIGIKRRARRTAQTEASPALTSGAIMYARILVPVDGSPTSEAGLAEAIRLARMCGGRIRLMHLVDDLPYMQESAMFGAVVPELLEPARERGAALLGQWSARVVQAGVEVDTMLLQGNGAHLVEFVNGQVGAWKADVIVLGTHGRHGLGRALIGSDAEKIVRQATVPVLLVRCDTRLASKEDLPAARTAEGAAN
jgi:nucleotide-binding universal stress UspA family protein